VMFDGQLDDIVGRFAASKVVETKFASEVTCDFSELGTVLEQKPDSVRIEVPRDRVADVCRALLDKAPVADFTIVEPPIEDIIRQVFGENAPARA
jgi:ABC-2 type transport system ATP-binding protein